MEPEPARHRHGQAGWRVAATGLGRCARYGGLEVGLAGDAAEHDGVEVGEGLGDLGVGAHYEQAAHRDRLADRLGAVCHDCAFPAAVAGGQGDPRDGGPWDGIGPGDLANPHRPTGDRYRARQHVEEGAVAAGQQLLEACGCSVISVRWPTSGCSAGRFTLSCNVCARRGTPAHGK